MGSRGHNTDQSELAFDMDWLSGGRARRRVGPRLAPRRQQGRKRLRRRLQVAFDINWLALRLLLTLTGCQEKREFFIDILLVRIHYIIVMILVAWPCAMGV